MAFVALSAQAAEPAPTSAMPATPRICASLVPVPWPTSMVDRRLHLRRLEGARPQCIADAEFLAALGALWLEDGDAEQARVWLERSLMLDADSPGAQADHALALAALGEPTALRELLAAWRVRNDVPAALRDRLLSAVDPGQRLRLPSARLGADQQAVRRSTRGDAALLLGYETNLAMSPRLTELTLTPPEGPVVLPVLSVPRRGAAVRADLSWQAAWGLSSRQVVRSGLSLSARSAPGASETDWHQFTAAVAYARQWGDWGGSAHVDAAWFGGALTEPYGLVRARAELSLALENCDQQLQLEVDGRRQSRTRSADSTTSLLAWRLQCRPFGLSDWQWGLQWRGGIDRPNSNDRPGGTQRSSALSLRLAWRPSALASIDLAVGTLRLDDSEGYSELLSGGAVRWQKQSFVSLELSRALDLTWMPGAEWVLLLTRFRQDSNLELFRHQGTTAYSGLRWPW